MTSKSRPCSEGSERAPPRDSRARSARRGARLHPDAHDLGPPPLEKRPTSRRIEAGPGRSPSPSTGKATATRVNRSAAASCAAIPFGPRSAPHLFCWRRAPGMSTGITRRISSRPTMPSSPRGSSRSPRKCRATSPKSRSPTISTSSPARSSRASTIATIAPRWSRPRRRWRRRRQISTTWMRR